MKLLVLDGNSILNRAFFGIKLLTTKDGAYTNGIYGFLNILSKLREDAKPDAIAVAFDLKAPTFRHKAYAGYKAQRKGMPEELAAQMPLLKETLTLMGLRLLEAEGFEADDILGTEAAACAARGDDCVIATGDRDSLQLVGGHVTVLLARTQAGRPETDVYDVAAVRARYGVSPRQLIEVKALMGDTSDNIPGVAGVGEKTALSLIAAHGTLQGVYENLDAPDIRPSLKAKLEAGHQSAVMSRELAEIHTDAPVETDPDRLRPEPVDRPGLLKMFRKLEFFRLIEKMGLEDAEAPVGADGPAEPAAFETADDGAVLLERLQKAGEAGFTVLLDDAGFSALCFAFADGVVCATRSATAGFEELVRSLLSDDSIAKSTHDVKHVFGAAARAGLPLSGDWFDTMLAGYLQNPLASSYEPVRLCGELGLAAPALPDIPDAALAACARDAAAVRLIRPNLSEQLEQNGQHKLFYEVEIPLARVLADMETVGFRVDSDGIRAYGQTLNARLDEIRKSIYGQVGYEFNLNSTKQLGEALFVKLGLPPKKKTKTGFSTNVEVLEALKGYHPVIGLLLEYRQLSKLKSTYTEGLLKVVGPDGRIHSSFNQVETRTGRISSTEPNLQNIPIRSDAGRELRKFFIPADGMTLIDADYSQIELRVLAHIADDTAMQDAFNRNEDIHTLTASQVFKMPPELITPLLRRRAKAVNFGIVYGISAFSLAQDIGVSVREADSYIKSYLETFSGVRRYMKETIDEARGRGYVETLLGRRRSLPELKSSNFNIRSAGERIALNTPIQGTAADIIKIAMVRVHDRLLHEGLRARLILQVHDELIVESPFEEAERVKTIVCGEMEGAMHLKVKLLADVHSGASWYAAK